MVLRSVRNEEDYEEMKIGNGAPFCDRGRGNGRGNGRVFCRTRRSGTRNTSTGTNSHLQHRWVK